MPATFATLKEAQAYARANNITKYYRLQVTRRPECRRYVAHAQMQQNNHWTVFYFDETEITARVSSILRNPDRMQITCETLYTDEVSDSKNAR